MLHKYYAETRLPIVSSNVTEYINNAPSGCLLKDALCTGPYDIKCRYECSLIVSIKLSTVS